MPTTSMWASTRTSGTSMSSLSGRRPWASRASLSGSTRRSTASARRAVSSGGARGLAAEVELAVGADRRRRAAAGGRSARAARRARSGTRPGRAGRRRARCRARASGRRCPRSWRPRMSGLASWRGQRPAAVADQRGQRRDHRRVGEQPPAEVPRPRPAAGSTTRASPSSAERPSWPAHRHATANGPVDRDEGRRGSATASAGVASSVTSASITSALSSRRPAPTSAPRTSARRSWSSRAELEEVEQLADLVDVDVAHVERLGIGVERDVADEHHELGVLARLRLVLGQVGPQLRASARRRARRCRRARRRC